MTSISGAADALSSPGVGMAELFLPEPGQRIRKATNHSDRYGQIICTATSREQAMLRCERAIAKINIVMTEDAPRGD